jgi:GLPGLI family protein
MKHLFLVFLLCSAITIFGQPKFISSGIVEFEKRVNAHAMLGNSTWDEERKRAIPQFQSTYFNLYFTPAQTLYKGGREVEMKYNQWGLQPSEDVVATNFETGKLTQRKHLFEEVYLLTEDVLKIKWKITNETRTIAGFDCRKAEGIFKDSLYVFAFYTDQIVVPAGPELFNGLPGLILGIAFPRRHTTWFATSLTLTEVTPQQLLAPTKGNRIERDALFPLIKKGMEWWDENSKANIRYAAML